MAFDPLSLAFGLLGGGGGSNTLTNTGNFNSVLQNSFSPVANVNLGGSIMADPSSGVSGSPYSEATSAVTPSAGSLGLGSIGMGAGVPVQTGFSIADNLPSLAIGGAALYFLMRDKK